MKLLTNKIKEYDYSWEKKKIEKHGFQKTGFTRNTNAKRETDSPTKLKYKRENRKLCHKGCRTKSPD